MRWLRAIGPANRRLILDLEGVWRPHESEGRNRLRRRGYCVEDESTTLEDDGDYLLIRVKVTFAQEDGEGHAEDDA